MFVTPVSVVSKNPPSLAKAVCFYGLLSFPLKNFHHPMPSPPTPFVKGN